jgi:lipopolysaccharide transport system ATP-binding protein
MPNHAITLESIGKKYRLGTSGARYRTVSDALTSFARRFRGAGDTADRDHWALSDVSFAVPHGTVLGVIGRNGAGKSTLLKILSRITEPTTGQAVIDGRIGSLLEVGTGFHPELTGRENIFLNGAVLGMQRAEIARKFDEIVAFAEVEKFLDTQVKYYSSGMYMRLAFAVAAHLEPEILVVDEVLAVGDVAFQKKCLGKMESVAHQGRTILFVSHSMAALEQLTTRCVLLENGRLAFEGPTSAAIAKYLDGSARSQSRYFGADLRRRNDGLSRAIEFVELSLEDAPNGWVSGGLDLRLSLKVACKSSNTPFRFSGTLFQASGSPVGSFFTPDIPAIEPATTATYSFSLPTASLAPASYYLALAVGRGSPETGHVDYDIVFDVLHFTIGAAGDTEGTQALWPSAWGPIRFPVAAVELTSDAAT